jgi:hypothetical protein
LSPTFLAGDRDLEDFLATPDLDLVVVDFVSDGFARADLALAGLVSDDCASESTLAADFLPDDVALPIT